jgi:hypothetical protein
MESINGKSKEKPLSFQEFKSIVQGLIKQEKEKTEDRTGHFNEFENVDELTEEDQKMWELVESDWEKAQEEIREYIDRISYDKKSRRIFAEYLCNVIMRNIYKSRK